MEEIRETAQVYYKAMPKKVGKLVEEFFKKMGDNGDGKVSFAQFAGFIGEEDYEAMNNPTFFEEINKNKAESMVSTMSKRCTTYYTMEGHCAVVTES
ncbi:hypothetical protein LOK49_LG08G02588 [Camellia lanceoleosa]|uniref:Uncharacterized protein n=1 Tax=Camellia lanceoleosa TaxID=1840588 RepID=A0ACC0GT43_9ERIC|nr:hypothetical protein LOK49_LG08G02588 [Camellia lanceoleosa]